MSKYIRDEILLLAAILYTARDNYGESALQRSLNEAKKLIKLAEEDPDID